MTFQMEFKGIFQKSRKCRFPEEGNLKLFDYYTKSNCELECAWAKAGKRRNKLLNKISVMYVSVFLVQTFQIIANNFDGLMIEIMQVKHHNKLQFIMYIYICIICI